MLLTWSENVKKKKKKAKKVVQTGASELHSRRVCECIELDQSSEGEGQGGSYGQAQSQEEGHQGSCGLGVFRLHQPDGRCQIFQQEPHKPTAAHSFTVNTQLVVPLVM